MSAPGPHVLVAGAGSVGRRHARNLAGLGCRVSWVDPREDRRAELGGELPDAARGTGHADVAQALAGGGLQGMVVASPTAFHVDQAIAGLAAGIPVLLEKPASVDLPGAIRLSEALAQSRAPLLLGYTWRWWPPLVEARRRLCAGDVGRPIHARFHMAAHLADWHPWEPYTGWFMADAALGGGALLDESHWIDQMLWFFAPARPARVFARIDRLALPGITSDDNVDMLVEYPPGDGPRVALHLDLYTRPHVKEIEVFGDAGTLRWTPGEVSVCRADASGVWETRTYTTERNEMFLAVARDFVGLLEGRAGPLACTLQDGVAVMRVIDAARRSHASGRSEEISG